METLGGGGPCSRSLYLQVEKAQVSDAHSMISKQHFMLFMA